MAALDKSGAAGDNSEELILELFDVLERCPAEARDAATDAALEAIAAVAAPDESDPVIAHRFDSLVDDHAHPSSSGVSFS